jgi:predicted Rossmann fold flavoprotein
MDFAIIGYGAAGTFAALRLREALIEDGRTLDDDRIFLIEKSGQGLRKVKISGGGRCNVTHYEFDPKEMVKNYPRGQKELLGPFHQFQAADTLAWFEKRGVKIVPEEDGRMFPKTNSSQTIIDCFMHELEKAKVEILCRQKISQITVEKRPQENHFSIKFEAREGAGPQVLTVRALLLASGSDPSGHALAKGLGHSLTDLAPSLFTFKVKSPLLKGLAGTTFTKAETFVKVAKANWHESGPLLITHWGLSGPAILKISSWAARELKAVNYHFNFTVNFTGLPYQEISDHLKSHLGQNPKKLLINAPFPGITRQFWANMIHVLERDFPNLTQKKCNELSKRETSTIHETLGRCSFQSVGSHRFKEEFVECGGVKNKEVNFKTMESKLVEGLFFAGEILDVDGLTGGFNFQNAWTGGFIAGQSMAKKTNVI